MSGVAAANRRMLNPITNVGRETPSSHHHHHHSGGINWEDRCAKLQEENRQLKIERNEKDQLITDLTTKFRKLTKDYKALAGVAPNFDGLSTQSGTGGITPRAYGSSRLSAAKLAQVEAQRDKLQRQVDDLRRQLGHLKSISPNLISTVQSSKNMQFRQESIEDYLARQEREAIRSGSGDGGARSARSTKSASAGRISARSVLGTPDKSSQRAHSSHSDGSNGSKDDHHGRLGSANGRIAQLTREVENLQQQHQRDSARVAQLEADKNDLAAQLRTAAQNNNNKSISPSKQQPPAPSTMITPSTSSTQGHSPSSGNNNNAELVDTVRKTSQEAQLLRERLSATEGQLQMVKRDRDDLEFKLRLKPTSTDYTGYRSTDADPDTLLKLQQEVSEKSSQLTVLTSRFTHSQDQVLQMKKECDRLIEELKLAHAASAEAKKKIFELEQEKATLELKTDRVTELEAAHRLKSDEIVQYEQKVLNLVDRLQTCTRETEHQVRRSCNERFNELEAMREEADRNRRAKERENFTLQQDLSDAQHKVKSLQEDMEQYKQDVTRLRTENRELHEKTSFLGAVPQDLSDDVHKAMAMVNLKKKREDELDVGELWQGIEWSDGWEAGRMREAVSTATYDLQLAEQRYQQMSESLEERNTLLRGITEERDQLLQDNIDLRRRISGIQTTLTKRMLKAQAEGEGTVLAGSTSTGGAVISTGSGASVHAGIAGTGSLCITLTHIDCNPSIAKVPEGSGSVFTPTLFFSLEGLDGYELAIGENFYTVVGSVSTTFVFSGLPTTLATMESITSSHFTLQLHQSYGTECDVVAAATISGAHLLSDFHGSGSVAIKLPLVSGNEGGASNSASVGSVSGNVTLSDEFLPFLLERKLVPTNIISSEMLNATLLSLRAVSALRVQIFGCKNLALGPGGAVPQPYIFYSVINLPTGMTSFINDTVIHPTTGDSIVSQNPSFESTAPTEHPVVIDSEIVRFLHEASISFIVFNAVSADIETNLGIANVPLKKLAESPSATVQLSEQLHPTGTLEIGLSWVNAH